MDWFDDGRPWHSGSWSFELCDDEIANVTFDGHSVLRSIRAVIRDEDWNTVDLAIDAIDEAPERLTMSVRSVAPAADLTGTIEVTVHDDELVVRLELESRAEFWTNRTGLVILHPPQTAGAVLDVTHPDGSTERSAFPLAISPHQPVVDIAELRWQYEGLAIDVQFTGDVFEMEDQRNWTDASYKTYSRPLSLPFPYRLAPLERATQSVRVRVGRLASPAVKTGPLSRIVLEPTGPFPEIVLTASTAPDPAPLLAEQPGTAILVELDLATSNWRAALARATSSNRPLDVRFVLAEQAPGAIADGAAALVGLPVVRAAAFWRTGPARHVSDVAATDALRRALDAVGVVTSVVGGARSHFTEINREGHRLPHDLDGLVFSVTPLFHSASTQQLVESLGVQRIVALQAVELRGIPVHIGPVTLHPRFNDVATTLPPTSSRVDLDEGYGTTLRDPDDPRQDAPELAAWTIASAAAMAVPGVASLAYFEEWGPRGITTAEGAPRPVADAVWALAALSGRTLLWGDSPNGLLWALGSTHDAETILVANLDRRDRTASVHTPSGTTEVAVGPGAWRRIRRPTRLREQQE